MSGFKCFSDNILILMDWKRDERSEEVVNGIVRPHTARKPEVVASVWATVLDAGPGHHDDVRGRWQPMDPAIKKGARVLVDMSMMGAEYFIGGVEHRIVRQKNIHAVEET
jgi:co-chaperonin GroES (HSP10)